MFNRVLNYLKNLSDLKVFLILFAIGFLVYGNTISNGFIGDDTAFLVDNPLIQTIPNPKTLFTSGILPDQGLGQENNYYRPFSILTNAIIYSTFENSILPFHIVHILLHVLVSSVLFLIFRQFFKKGISFFLSLVFLVHPINAETVLEIGNLQEAQFLLFGLAAFYLWIKNYKYEMFLVPLLLLASLLTKESGIFFGFIIFLFSFLFSKKKLGQSILAGIVALIAYLVLRLGLAHVFLNQLKITPIMALPLGERIINIPKIIFFYLKTFLYPNDLIMFQTWLVKQKNFTDFYLPLILDIIFFSTLLLVGLIIKKRDVKLFKIFVFFFIWFVIGLSFYLQIIPVDQTVSDRYFYFPIIGLLGLIGAIIQYFGSKTSVKKLYLVKPIFIGIIILFCTRVIIRNTNWKDESSLYTHDIKFNSNSFQLEQGLGRLAFLRGSMEESEMHYIRSSNLFPSSMIYNNLGYFYLLNHKPNEAKEIFNTALKYGDYPLTYQNLATLSLANDDSKTAEAFIENSLRKFPNYSELWVDLAVVKYKLGDKEGAIAAAKKAYLNYPSQKTQNVLDVIENDGQIDIGKF